MPLVRLRFDEQQRMEIEVVPIVLHLQLRIHRSGASIRYIVVWIAAFYQMFQNCDHWARGSTQTTWVCTGSFTPK
jgi:hypothetical protein